jgi:hypothetical protein
MGCGSRRFLRSSPGPMGSTRSVGPIDKLNCPKSVSVFDQVKRLVGPSINTGIKYREDFFKQALRRLTDSLGLSGTKIDGLDLLNHDKTGHLWIVDNGHVEWKFPICVGYGANDSKSSVSVEQGIAHDKGRPPTSLFMAGLWVKGDGDKVGFSW